MRINNHHINRESVFAGLTNRSRCRLKLLSRSSSFMVMLFVAVSASQSRFSIRQCFRGFFSSQVGFPTQHLK